MSFQLHPDAKAWFKKVRVTESNGKEPLETWFDVFQMCFVLGIAKSRYEPLNGGGYAFMGEFIARYRNHHQLMIGSMISRSLERQGVALDDRKAVVKEIERLVDSSEMSTTILKPEGFRELNAYAAGGFNYLREEFVTPPSDMVFLLNKYYQLLGQDEASSVGPML